MAVLLPADADAVVNGPARERRRLQVLLRRPRRKGRRRRASVADLVEAVALPEVLEGHVDAASALKDGAVARLLKRSKGTLKTFVSP